MNGPDHKSSIEPNDFKNMVRGIRKIEKALGSPIKQPSLSELKNIKTIRKSIVASKKIRIGEKFDFENLTFKRPGLGLSPMLIDQVIGKISNRNYEKDDLIDL